jgi:hypothetical protein
MDRSEWEMHLEILEANRAHILRLEPEPPNLAATRCERSRHRTLAHLRACQEQWLLAVRELIVRENPNLTILHPWRKFDQANYAEVPWKNHLDSFLKQREEWLGFRSLPDWNRAGKMNRKPISIGSLTRHLAVHESYHLGLLPVVK